MFPALTSAFHAWVAQDQGNLQIHECSVNYTSWVGQSSLCQPPIIPRKHAVLKNSNQNSKHFDLPHVW